MEGIAAHYAYLQLGSSALKRYWSVFYNFDHFTSQRIIQSGALKSSPYHCSIIDAGNALL
jgi:hypothetical protein